MRNVSSLTVSQHCCKVETGRYNRTAWCDQQCDRCGMNQVQDELHGLMECDMV